MYVLFGDGYGDVDTVYHFGHEVTTAGNTTMEKDISMEWAN